MAIVIQQIPFTTTLFTGVLVWTVYTASKILYRLLLHPLRAFPGPKSAAATFWYEAYYDVFKEPGGQFVYHLDELHDRYGPIIRCSPEEIHIRDSEWFDTLYTGPGHVRDKWERSNRANGSPGSVASAWKHDLHRARRGPLYPFFSKRAINELEDSVREKTLKLCNKLDQCAKKGKIVDLGTAFTAVTLDVITQYCYDRCQNTLDEPDFAPRWKKLMSGLFEGVSIGKHFPLVMQTMQKLPRSVVEVVNPDMVPFFEAQDLIAAQAKEVWLEEKTKGHIKKREQGDEKPKTIFHGILQSSLPDQEKSLARLQDEAFVLIVAGGETTARVTTTILAHLLQHQDLCLQLRKELDKVIKPGSNVLPTSSVLEKIPLMKAIVQEGLRIGAPVTNRPMLIAPNEDLVCKKYTLPRGTPVSQSLRNVLFDPVIFPNPHTFAPDRWLQQSGSRELERYLVTFSKGSRGCLGQNVAYAEIYLVVAAVLSSFDLQLVDFDQNRDLDIQRDCFVGMPSKESRGVRVKVMQRRR